MIRSVHVQLTAIAGGQLVLLMAVTVFGAKMACLGYYQESRERRDECEKNFLRLFSLGKASYADVAPIWLCSVVIGFSSLGLVAQEKAPTST